jgi:hypothetical protein
MEDEMQGDEESGLHDEGGEPVMMEWRRVIHAPFRRL